MSMPKQAMLFGGLLVLLAVAGYGLASAGVGTPAPVVPADGAAGDAAVVAGAKKGPSVTLFIPAVFGGLLILCGGLATKESLRKHAMHAAATIALLGGLVAGGRGLSALLKAPDPEKPVNLLATISVWSMSILCLAFVGLCVQSFMAAARARRSATKEPTNH